MDFATLTMPAANSTLPRAEGGIVCHDTAGDSPAQPFGSVLSAALDEGAGAETSGETGVAVKTKTAGTPERPAWDGGAVPDDRLAADDEDDAATNTGGLPVCVSTDWLTPLVCPIAVPQPLPVEVLAEGQTSEKAELAETATDTIANLTQASGPGVSLRVLPSVDVTGPLADVAPLEPSPVAATLPSGESSTDSETPATAAATAALALSIVDAETAVAASESAAGTPGGVDSNPASAADALAPDLVSARGRTSQPLTTRSATGAAAAEALANTPTAATQAVSTDVSTAAHVEPARATARAGQPAVQAPNMQRAELGTTMAVSETPAADVMAAEIAATVVSEQVAQTVQQSTAAGQPESRASLAYRQVRAGLDELSSTTSSLMSSAQSALAGTARQVLSDTYSGQGGTSGNGGSAKQRAAEASQAYATTVRAGTFDFATRALDLAAAVSVASQAESAEPTVDGASLNSAVVKSLKLQWSQGGGEAKLQLRPEYLGELTVSLKVQGSSVTAVLQADSPAVRSWVATHQDELRRALEESGLSLDELVIDADGHQQGQQQQASQDNPRQSSRQRQGNAQFEVLL